MKAEEKFKYLRKLAKEPAENLTWPTNHEQIEARELLAFWDANQWQPIEDSKHRNGILWNGSHPVQGYQDSRNGWCYDMAGNRVENVTHWQSLPKGPQ